MNTFCKTVQIHKCFFSLVNKCDYQETCDNIICINRDINGECLFPPAWPENQIKGNDTKRIIHYPVDKIKCERCEYFIAEDDISKDGKCTFLDPKRINKKRYDQCTKFITTKSKLMVLTDHWTVESGVGYLSEYGTFIPLEEYLGSIK